MNRLDEIDEFLGSVSPYSEECLEDISCTRSWTLWSDDNLDDMRALLAVAKIAYLRSLLIGRCCLCDVPDPHLKGHDPNCPMGPLLEDAIP